MPSVLMKRMPSRKMVELAANLGEPALSNEPLRVPEMDPALLGLWLLPCVMLSFCCDCTLLGDEAKLEGCPM